MSFCTTGLGWWSEQKARRHCVIVVHDPFCVGVSRICKIIHEMHNLQSLAEYRLASNNPYLVADFVIVRFHVYSVFALFFLGMRVGYPS